MSSSYSKSELQFNLSRSNQPEKNKDPVAFSKKALDLSQLDRQSVNKRIGDSVVKEKDLNSMEYDSKYSALISMIKSVLGEFVAFDSDSLSSRSSNSETSIESPNASASTETMSLNFESEAVSYEASGKIITSDNLEINFTTQFQLNRSFFSMSDIRSGSDKQDPLVFNFEGNSVELQNTKFSFDLMSDGNLRNISYLNPSSAFLAYDKNNDGQVNNGSELFGTSGDGFKELSQYDDDSNGWIDENDSVFNRLSLWQKSENIDNLISIKSIGVGAIFLGSANTRFDINDSQNENLGILRKTGIALYENGKLASVQQIDL